MIRRCGFPSLNRGKEKEEGAPPSPRPQQPTPSSLSSGPSSSPGLSCSLLLAAAVASRPEWEPAPPPISSLFRSRSSSCHLLLLLRHERCAAGRATTTCRVHNETTAERLACLLVLRPTKYASPLIRISSHYSLQKLPSQQVNKTLGLQNVRLLLMLFSKGVHYSTYFLEQ